MDMGTTHHQASILSKYEMSSFGTMRTCANSACVADRDVQDRSPPAAMSAEVMSNSDTTKISREMMIAVNSGRRKVTVISRDERHARSESCWLRRIWLHRVRLAKESADMQKSMGGIQTKIRAVVEG